MQMYIFMHLYTAFIKYVMCAAIQSCSGLAVILSNEQVPVADHFVKELSRPAAYCIQRVLHRSYTLASRPVDSQAVDEQIP